jgi:ribose transport system permease protein
MSAEDRAVEEPANNGASHAEAIGGRQLARRVSFSESLERYGLLLILALAAIAFSILPASASTFPTVANFTNLVGDEVVLCIVALAFMLPLAVGYFDLSIASIAGLSSVAAASAMAKFGAPLLIAVLLAVLVGSLVGVVNAYLITRLRLDSIIVTLASMTLITGVVQWYTGGLSIDTGISPALTDFGSLAWLSVPRITYLLVLVIICIWYVLEQTPYGRYLRMIGSNRAAARLVGIPVDRAVFATFVLSGTLAGVAGVLLTARSGGANPQDGPGLLIPGLAAVFLGATAVKPGRFNVFGTILGVFFVAIIVSGLTLSGVQPFVEPLFNGAALLVAVGLSTTLRRRRSGGADA